MINIKKYSNCNFIKGKLISFGASLTKASQIFSSILNIHKGPILSGVLHQHFLKGCSGKFDDERLVCCDPPNSIGRRGGNKRVA